MKRLLVYIAAAILGLWLAVMFIPGVHISLYPDSSFFGFRLTAAWQIYLLLGILLGLLNFFIKPLLDLITLPLRIITLGLFGFLVDIILVVALDMMFRELTVPWVFPLAWTTVIIWILTFLFSRFVNNKEA